MDIKELTNQIINGHHLTGQQDLSFFVRCDLQELCENADRIRKHFCGERVDLCSIINGRSGQCSEDCKYCAQSVHHHTNCGIYDFMDEDMILSAALENEKEGVHRFSVVTSGRSLNSDDFEKVKTIYERIHRECNLSLCASHGFLSSEQFEQLRQAGVTRYHCNIETSPRYFPSICTTHTFEEKLANIRRAQEAGLSVCSGGIIGMGESWEDRIQMALTLSELEIQSIPLNELIPIPGTPLEHLPQTSPNDILRTVALFRFLNPQAHIRMAAGRALLPHSGAVLFTSGASATITGNMLTTTGSTIEDDKKMLMELGRNF